MNFRLYICLYKITFSCLFFISVPALRMGDNRKASLMIAEIKMTTKRKKNEYSTLAYPGQFIFYKVFITNIQQLAINVVINCVFLL